MTCVFCDTSSSDENLGESQKLSNYRFHSNCLVYSWDIRQNKDTTKGLHGFETKNIKFALDRAQDLICSFCSKKGASLRCCESKCKARFHLPCALKSQETIHLHFHMFKSYCKEHNSYKCVFDNNPITGINLNAGCCKELYSHENCLKKYVIEKKAKAECPKCKNVKNFRTYVENLDCEIPKGATTSLEEDPVPAVGTKRKRTAKLSESNKKKARG